MEARGIRLDTTIAPTIFYLGANWLDPVVGGNSGARAQAAPGARDRGGLGGVPLDLRQRPRRALAQPARARHLRLPRGQGEHQPGDARVEGRQGAAPADRGGEEAARRGRLSGRARREDRAAAGALPRHHARAARATSRCIDWWRKQFAKLSVQFEPRQTDWNRFQEKLRKGSTQLFIVGWSADYPDPENFMFLLHGPQSRAKNAGRERLQLRQPGVRRAVRAHAQHAERARSASRSSTA